jgi:membrane protease YdiL (CAAX protease family)
MAITESVDTAARRPLFVFLAIATAVSWLVLSIPVALALAAEPFVLVVVLAGLLAPALLLTFRDSGRAGLSTLFRDARRLPRPLWWGPVAALAIPCLTWNVASLLGGAAPLTVDRLTRFVVAVVVGLLVINLWEELAWTGFFQRRAISAWGPVRGTLVTAAGFAAVHLPLAFAGADGPGDVLLGVAVLVGTAVGVRFLITGLDAWSGRSLLTIGLLHASFNATYDLVDPAYDWVRLVLTVVLGLVSLVLVTRNLESS